MMPREIAETLFDRPPGDGVETGYIAEWQRGTGFRKIPGTDGALIYMGAFAGTRIGRIPKP
jgi:hypothetical protein